MGRDVTARRRFYTTVAILGLGCIACFLAASFESSESGQMAGIDPAEASAQATFALDLYAIGLINLVAAMALVVRQSGLTWWLVVAIQAAVFFAAVAEGVMTDIGWFYFSALPLLTLLALRAFGESRSRLRPGLLILCALAAVVMVGLWTHGANARPPNLRATSHPIPLPSGLTLTCTDNYLSHQAMGPIADGNDVHFVCDNGKVLAWWIDRNAGTETVPPG